MLQLEQIGLYTGHRIALLLLSLLLLGFVLELVRRDHLKEKYALFWLATALFGVAIGIYPDFIVLFAQTVRFQMLTALFVFSFIFILAIVLAFTVVISRLTERNRELTQEMALLANRVNRFEQHERNA